MLISGFTFVRNIEKMKYPAIESIKSILPICDEFIVNVCRSEDLTVDLINSIKSDKIKIVNSVWDSSKLEKGLVLSQNTNIALNACLGEWCFYIQADEVVHEDDLNIIKDKCERYRSDKNVQGFLFDYLHFYGSHNVVAASRSWYRNEVRIVRNFIGARSIGDAQGFRIGYRKPNVIDSGARIFHYGWVKEPKDMGLKNKHFSRLWHGNKFDNAFNNFQYEQQYGLKYYEGAHPEIMKERIAKLKFKFVIDKTKRKWNLKTIRLALSDILENFFGFRLFEHKNYKKVL